ncbi:retrovirus-related pol polyprotein from transposon TNT 1-94, partial [Tanacetum coccineum]
RCYKASVGIQEKESLAEVWHKRMGHISEAGLHELEKREVLGNKGLGGFEFTFLDTRMRRSASSRSGSSWWKTKQNGLAERINRMLLNKVRCLLIQSGLPDSFWAEATIMEVDVKPKIIISRDVVFNESLMYKDTLKGADVADSRKKVEFEVELQGSRVKPTMDPHTGENLGNEDEEQDEGPQQQNLDNYVLVRDRAKRTIAIPVRYMDEGNVSLSRPLGSRVEDDMAAYAFVIAEEKDTHEPITF